ncbi:MAG: ribose 5-phosphate isomerase A, partial [Thermoproteota archaeon]
GLGSGSTAAYAIQEIGDRINQEEINVSAVPTSYQSLILAVEYGIPLTSLEEHAVLDLTIDGADQIDGQLNLLKGMGGALAREKIVASASKKLIIIVDERKKVESLGEDNHPVPLEVLPFALPVVIQKIRKIGGKPVLREAEGKVGPVITDNGNVIVDIYLDILLKLEEINYQLKRIPGVVETGIFVDMADLAYIGNGSEIKELKKTI